MTDDDVDAIVFLECIAEVGHGPPWPPSLVRSIRRAVRDRLAGAEPADPALWQLH